MDYDLVIRNGCIITASENFVGDVAVWGEKIAAVGQDLRGAREIDAQGMYVIPGAVDGHVHLQMPIADWGSRWIRGTNWLRPPRRWSVNCA